MNQLRNKVLGSLVCVLAVAAGGCFGKATDADGDGSTDLGQGGSDRIKAPSGARAGAGGATGGAEGWAGRTGTAGAGVKGGERDAGGEGDEGSGGDEGGEGSADGGPTGTQGGTGGEGGVGPTPPTAGSGGGPAPGCASPIGEYSSCTGTCGCMPKTRRPAITADSAINECGQATAATVAAGTVTAWGESAHLSSDGTMLIWDDGAVWVRTCEP